MYIFRSPLQMTNFFSLLYLRTGFFPRRMHTIARKQTPNHFRRTISFYILLLFVCISILSDFLRCFAVCYLLFSLLSLSLFLALLLSFSAHNIHLIFLLSRAPKSEIFFFRRPFSFRPCSWIPIWVNKHRQIDRCTQSEWKICGGKKHTLTHTLKIETIGRIQVGFQWSSKIKWKSEWNNINTNTTNVEEK